MKRVLLTLLLLCSHALATVTVVNTWIGHGVNAGTAVTVAPTNGNTLIASLCFFNNSTVTSNSLTDQGSNALTLDAHVGPSSSDGCYWYRKTNQSGITSLTPNLTGSAFWKLFVAEVSGLDGVAPLGAIDTTGAGGNPWTTGTVSANAGDIVFGAGYSDINTGACGAGTGWTLAGGDGNDGVGGCLIYDIAPSTASYAANGTGFTRVGYAIVYKASGAAPPSKTCTITLTGAGPC